MISLVLKTLAVAGIVLVPFVPKVGSKQLMDKLNLNDHINSYTVRQCDQIREILLEIARHIEINKKAGINEVSTLKTIIFILEKNIRSTI